MQKGKPVDAVAFTSPRRSVIDIVQAAGRAMRKGGEKKVGYILIPARVDRAEALLDRPIVQHVFNAVDVLGWKVVQQDPTIPGRWPVPYWDPPTAKWPSRCDDSDREKPAAKLRLIDGGKPDGDGGAAS
jgi:hypothetical protein